jgi:hypothetical protein
MVEQEAEALRRMPVAQPARHAATPDGVHPFWPILMAVGAGIALYWQYGYKKGEHIANFS